MLMMRTKTCATVVCTLTDRGKYFMKEITIICIIITAKFVAQHGRSHFCRENFVARWKQNNRHFACFSMPKFTYGRAFQQCVVEALSCPKLSNHRWDISPSSPLPSF